MEKKCRVIDIDGLDNHQIKLLKKALNSENTESEFDLLIEKGILKEDKYFK